MEKGKIAVRDVAEYASTSPAIISRVLNDCKWISSEIKERIQKTVDELHYVPDFTAKVMVWGGGQVVVVIVPIIDDHFFIQLISTVIQEIKKCGYYVVVYTTESTDGECSFPGGFICQTADGILDATPLKELLPLQNVRKPMVLIDYYSEGNTTIDCAMNRNYEALYRDIEYLIRHGHNRVALLMEAEGHGIAEERIRGLRDGLQAHGLPWREEYSIQDCWKTKANIRYASRLLELPDPSTAVIARSNALTTDVLEVMRNRRVMPGGDISMTGFEGCNEDVQVSARYGIASSCLDIPAIASYVAKLLLNRMEQSGKHTRARVEALELNFIERISVCAPLL